MLEKAGGNILGIEGNVDAFLRCLIVKNIFNLKANFQLGDFMQTFGSKKKYDLVVASGVLYHMENPALLLERMAAVTDRIFLWTHYWEPNFELWSSEIRNQIGTRWRPEETFQVDLGDLPMRVVPQYYGNSLGWAGFCGGPETKSNWVHKEDLLKALTKLGFNEVQTSFESPDHRNGPSLCILARRV